MAPSGSGSGATATSGAATDGTASSTTRFLVDEAAAATDTTADTTTAATTTDSTATDATTTDATTTDATTAAAPVEEPTTLNQVQIGYYEITNQQLFLEKIEKTAGKGSIVERYLGYFQGEKLTYNFSGLSNHTYYTVFYMATNEDPRFFLEKTAIKNVTTKTFYEEPVVVVKKSSGHMTSVCLTTILMSFAVLFGGFR